MAQLNVLPKLIKNELIKKLLRAKGWKEAERICCSLEKELLNKPPPPFSLRKIAAQALLRTDIDFETDERIPSELRTFVTEEFITSCLIEVVLLPDSQCGV